MSMHLGTFFFFQNSTLAAKRMSLKTRPYTFSLKKWTFECDKKVKERIITSILQTAMAL